MPSIISWKKVFNTEDTSFLEVDPQVIYKQFLPKRNNKFLWGKNIYLTVLEKSHQSADFHMKIWLKWLEKGEKMKNAIVQNAKAKNSLLSKNGYPLWIAVLLLQSHTYLPLILLMWWLIKNVHQLPKSKRLVFIILLAPFGLLKNKLNQLLKRLNLH